MAQKESTERYFWRSYELTRKQYRAALNLGTDDVFVETSTHPRDDDFIRKAWYDVRGV